MAKFEIDETTLKNLSVFLGRVDLKGSEVQEFNKIAYALSNPIQEIVNSEKSESGVHSRDEGLTAG